MNEPGIIMGSVIISMAVLLFFWGILIKLDSEKMTSPYWGSYPADLASGGCLISGLSIILLVIGIWTIYYSL